MTATTRPLIGITSSLRANQSGAPVCQVGHAYVRAVLQAGGLPTVIPTSKETNTLTDILSRIDGLLLSGGGDIDPQRFRGQPHPRIYGISPARDALEFSILENALDQGLPVLAICRGIQVLNVAFGGTLLTDIHDQYPHALRHDWFPDIPRDYLAHPVQLEPKSKLSRIFNTTEIRVNSLHHQGIATLGAGLRPIAQAPDGLVEGLAVEGVPFALGVQWHPECLPEDLGMQALFKTFIESC